MCKIVKKMSQSVKIGKKLTGIFTWGKHDLGRYQYNCHSI